MSVTKIILPKLGLTMDEGRLIAWHKKVGDRVEKGEVLFEVETDKANMEIESAASGFVRRILAPADTTVPVTTVIALLSDTADEPLPADAASGMPPGSPLAHNSPAPSSKGVPASASSQAQGSLDKTPASPAAAPSEGERVRSSPAARKRAQELGVDINAVRGMGPGGRVNIEDVEAAAGAGKAQAPATPGGDHREPLTRMRRAVAEAMTRSVREAPQFSVSRDVDMSAANAKRKAAGVSYTDVIVAAAANALRAHPRLRSRFDGDAIVTSEAVHVGIAVALEAGLIVPVVRDADRKALAALRDEREALEAAVATGRVRADAFGGAQITVSNLGPFGVDRFTAIVNPPEASILAVGRVSDRVVAVNGAPAVRPVVSLTLTVDHRVADGADAARYLAEVAKELETA
ncbi:MAG: dihydrolipoamide acetyltransferase family protein [Candidatus Limnocylindria bacterium]|nr:dihydrolipoamide acetyltransferase family protein [Candidatus Limnocylindria bacterium]